ncbi:MAG: hemolysin family protein [Thermomicrobiales bacterium]
MDGDGWLRILILVIAAIVIALAGLAQALIGVTSRQRFQALGGAPEQPAHHRTVRSLVDPRRTLVASMLTLQVVAAIVAAVELARFFAERGWNGLDWLAVVIVIVLYLVLGRSLAKALASKDLEPFLYGIFRLAHGLSTLLKPVHWVVDRIALGMVHVLPGNESDSANEGLEEDLRPHRYTSDDEVIGTDEREMIDGILSLEDMTVRDIMVPRLDIIAVDRTVSPLELIETITKAGHSRIPVYQESIDRVLGVLYAKDLLPFVIGSTSRIPLLDLIRPAFVVPESKKLNELFTELKRAKIHIAIVADEYGGTAGLVTIEDILEEIVGEIQDEYDTEEPLFERESRDVLLADGRLPIEDVEEALDLEFEEDDDFGTLGGFVHKHLGRLPIQGDVFEAEGVRVEILGVERHRVRKLRLTKLATMEDEDREAPRSLFRSSREESGEEHADDVASR